MNRARVFFFQQPVPNARGWTPDLSAAGSYGDFKFIFGIDDHPSKEPTEMAKIASEKLSDFDPCIDYLCWCNSGDVFSIYLIIGTLAAKGVKQINALSWNKPRSGETGGRYAPVTVPLCLS